ncbi:MAG TPA: tetratricopeptide repeat protein [Candidatus Binatia bacterium]|nr:tetratricopeptide repeat protein [Candidatus Binatia bacterium]
MADKEELYDSGLDLAFEGDFRGAIEKYRSALALDPSYVDAVHALAMAHKELGQLDEAIEVAKRLCELAPDDILAHTSLSQFYQMKGMIPEAEAASARAKVLDWKRQLGEQKKDGDGA